MVNETSRGPSCLALLIAVGAGCGAGRGVAPAAEQHAGDAAVATLGELARVLRDDDGPGLARLIHPTHGMWLWTHAGYLSPTLRLAAEGDAPPSARLATAAQDEAWREGYWAAVERGLTTGLARLDVDPADRHAVRYGDCAEPEADERRAWLATRADLDADDALLDEAGVTLSSSVRRELVEFSHWGLEVWLARERRTLWVVHVRVWTPCDG